MDKNEFKRRVEELAVIKERKPTKSPSHNRLAKEIHIEYDEDGNELEVEKEITENPTLGFDLVKVKDKTQSCELGCGDIVTNQLIERRFCSSPQPHWRTRCQNCDCYVSPDGLGFIKGSHQVGAEYKRFFSKRDKPEIKPIPKKEITHEPIVTVTKHYEETITNTSIIRKYY